MNMGFGDRLKCRDINVYHGIFFFCATFVNILDYTHLSKYDIFTGIILMLYVILIIQAAILLIMSLLFFTMRINSEILPNNNKYMTRREFYENKNASLCTETYINYFFTHNTACNYLFIGQWNR